MAEFWGFDQVDVKGLIFTSYNSLDWKRVEPIVLELRKLGVPMWYDYGLKAGTDAWGTQITRHIKKASAVILFVTRGIFERDNSYVIEEFREAEMFDIPIVPVFLDNITEKSFCRMIDDKYVRYVNFLNDLQGLAYPLDDDARETAAKIKGILDRSDDIEYTPEPWADTQTEMERLEEQARLAAEHHAKKESARQNAGERAEAQADLNVKVGSRVRFGCYPQGTNDPEPLMWRVLDIIGGKALMITEELIDCQKYNDTRKGVTWETCTLRKWLSDDFLRAAFSPGEQEKITAVSNQNPDNASYGTNGGNPTEDRVFCLNIDEAKRYFGSDVDRLARPTAYARKNGAYVSDDNGCGWWWLRSPGIDGNNAAIVLTGGGVYEYGNYVGSVVGCVRPVILVSL